MRKTKGFFYTTKMAAGKMVEHRKSLLALRIEKYKHIHGRKDMNLAQTEVVH